jgi:hypothetical protein
MLPVIPVTINTAPLLHFRRDVPFDQSETQQSLDTKTLGYVDDNLVRIENALLDLLRGRRYEGEEGFGERGRTDDTTGGEASQSEAVKRTRHLMSCSSISLLRDYGTDAEGRVGIKRAVNP